jgi:hypothetical protein
MINSGKEHFRHIRINVAHSLLILNMSKGKVMGFMMMFCKGTSTQIMGCKKIKSVKMIKVLDSKT